MSPSRNAVFASERTVRFNVAIDTARRRRRERRVVMSQSSTHRLVVLEAIPRTARLAPASRRPPHARTVSPASASQPPEKAPRRAAAAPDPPSLAFSSAPSLAVSRARRTGPRHARFRPPEATATGPPRSNLNPAFSSSTRFFFPPAVAPRPDAAPSAPVTPLGDPAILAATSLMNRARHASDGAATAPRSKRRTSGFLLHARSQRGAPQLWRHRRATRTWCMRRRPTGRGRSRSSCSRRTPPSGTTAPS